MSSVTARLLSGSVLRVITLIVGVVTSFFMMPFLIHSIGDRWYGMWILVGSFAGYYPILLDFGLSIAAQRFIAYAYARNDHQEFNVVLVTSLILFSVIGLVALCVTIGVAAIAGPIFLDDPVEIKTFRGVVLILGTNVSLSFPFAAFNGIITTKLRYDISCYVEISKIVLRTVLSIYVINKGYSIIYLAFITLIVNIVGHVVTVVSAYHICEEIQLKIRYFKIIRIRSYFIFGFYSFIIRVSDMIRFNIDSFVVSYFLGLTAVTHYNIAINLSLYYKQIINNIFGVIQPLFTKYYSTDDNINIKDKFLLTTRFSVIASTTISGAIIIFGKAFIIRWMGEIYQDAYLPLAILVAFMVLDLCQVSSVSLLQAIARHRFYAFMNSVESAANLILSLVLVQYYGMVGVALATAIPLLITKMFLQPRYVCRQIGYPVASYYREMGRLFLIVAAGQVPMFFVVKALHISSYLSILISGAVLYSLYSLILFRFVLSYPDRLLLMYAIPGLKSMSCPPVTSPEPPHILDVAEIDDMASLSRPGPSSV